MSDNTAQWLRLAMERWFTYVSTWMISKAQMYCDSWAMGKRLLLFCLNHATPLSLSFISLDEFCGRFTNLACVKLSGGSYLLCWQQQWITDHESGVAMVQTIRSKRDKGISRHIIFICFSQGKCEDCFVRRGDFGRYRCPWGGALQPVGRAFFWEFSKFAISGIALFLLQFSP